MRKNYTKQWFAALLCAATSLTASAQNMVEDASEIEVKQGSTILETTKGADGLTINSSLSGEFSTTFTLDETVNAGDAYYVMELSSTYNGSKRKVRYITVNGTGCGTSSETSNVCITLSNGHKLLIMSPLAQDASLKNVFKEGKNMTVTAATVNISTDATESFTIYKAGFYNLGEILNDYYSDLKGYDWQFVSCDNARIETINRSATATSGTIQIKSNTSTTDEATFRMLMKSLGKLPANYNLSFRYINWADDDNTIIHDDLFAEALAEGQKVSNLTTGNYFRYPTVRDVEVLGGYRHWKYNDGTDPSTVTNYLGWKTDKRQYASYIRNLKAGFSTIILPFDEPVDYLTKIGLTAYLPGEYNAAENKLSFVKAEAGTKIANNTPFIIKADVEGLYNIYYDDAGTHEAKGTYQETTIADGIKLVGSWTEGAPTTGDYADYDCYGINTDGKTIGKMNNETKATYYRAFIAISKDVQQAKPFSISLGDNTPTGINNISNNLDTNNKRIYNLQGAYVGTSLQDLPKGVYIVGGKKVVK